jgi:hypothetical protein
MSGEVTYKTHILVGVRTNGIMTVMAEWPHLPKQADVLEEIRNARDAYVTFVLCTPTSIMPANGNGDSAKRTPARHNR